MDKGMHRGYGNAINSWNSCVIPYNKAETKEKGGGSPFLYPLHNTLEQTNRDLT